MDGLHIPFDGLDDNYKDNSSRRLANHKELLKARLRNVDFHNNGSNSDEDEIVSYAVNKLTNKIKTKLKKQRNSEINGKNPPISQLHKSYTSSSPIQTPVPSHTANWDVYSSPQIVIDTLVRNNEALSDIVSKFAGSPRPPIMEEFTPTDDLNLQKLRNQHSNEMQNLHETYRIELQSAANKRKQRTQKIKTLQSSIAQREQEIKDLKGSKELSVREFQRAMFQKEELERELSIQSKHNKELKEEFRAQAELLEKQRKAEKINELAIEDKDREIQFLKTKLSVTETKNQSEENEKVNSLESDVAKYQAANQSLLDANQVLEQSVETLKIDHRLAMESLDRKHLTDLDKLDLQHNELILSAHRASEISNDKSQKVIKLKEDIQFYVTENHIIHDRCEQYATQLAELSRILNCADSKIVPVVQEMVQDYGEQKSAVVTLQKELLRYEQREINDLERSFDDNDLALVSPNKTELDDSQIWSFEEEI